MDLAEKLKIDNELVCAADIHKTLDRNNDGKVTKGEIHLALLRRQDELTAKGLWDHNEGRLCQIYKDILEHFNDADLNKDDKLSFIEYMVFFESAKAKYQ